MLGRIIAHYRIIEEFPRLHTLKPNGNRGEEAILWKQKDAKSHPSPESW